VISERLGSLSPGFAGERARVRGLRLLGTWAALSRGEPFPLTPTPLPAKPGRGVRLAAPSFGN
jgi:hypothetical protein